MVENIETYYTTVQNADATLQGIGLTENAGKYHGVIYQYGELKFAEEENSDGSLNLSFDWKLIDSNGLPKDLLNSEEFKNLLGDILVNIVDKHIKEGNIFYDDRGDNTSSVDAQ